MTSSSKSYPTRVEVFHNEKQGQIALDQIRTIDRQRIIRVFDQLNEDTVIKVKLVLKETYVD